MKFCKAGSLLLLLLPLGAIAQNQGATQSGADQQAYCDYLTEQAAAQRDLLRTPSALGAFTQPETGLPEQIVGGATLSLSNVKKAGIKVDAARKNCELYKATTAVTQYLQYALPAIEKEALTHRVELIDHASQSLDQLIAETAKIVAAQNMTRPMLWGLQTNKIKLDADRADAQSKIAALYVPALSAEPLKTQVANKQTSDLAEQQSLDKLARQSNWDVALTVGAHQQVNPVQHSVQPYGEVTATYNFASRAIDRHLDRSVTAYGNWKQVQEGDAARGMEVLHTQVLETIAAQQGRLKTLQQESDELAKNLKLVADADTSAALDFRNQLTATQLLLEIEVGDASFRLERLRAFLSKNY